MDIFQAVRNHVSMEAAAEYCGLRPSRGFCLCPFHTDHRPSFKLYPDHGYCYVCHTRADPISLVAYLNRLTQLQAAQELAHAFGIPGEFNPYVTTLHALRREQAAEDKEAAEAMLLSLTHMYRVLWDWHKTYAPKNVRELKKLDPRFILAIENLEYLEYIMDQYPTDPAKLPQWRQEVKNMKGLYALGDQIKKLEAESDVRIERYFLWKP